MRDERSASESSGGDRASEVRLPGTFIDVELVLIASDDLIASRVDIERAISPRRIAKALIGEGRPLGLLAFSVGDAWSLSELVREESVKASFAILEIASRLEIEWTESREWERSAGLAALAANLRDLGVKTAIVSALHRDAARAMCRRTIDLNDDVPCFGRTKPDSRDATIRDAVARAVDEFGAHHSRVLVIASQKTAEALDGLPTAVLPCDDDMIFDLASEFGDTSSNDSEFEASRQVHLRLKELSSRSLLTDDEMYEIGRLSGGVKHVGNVEAFGFVDPVIGNKNALILEATRYFSAKAGRILEMLGADAALLETELRNWMIVHHGKAFDADDRETFGQIASSVERFGFRADLVARLKTFNQLRNDAVHRLSRGAESYQGLIDRYVSDPSLLEDVRDFVEEQAPTYWS